EAEPHEEADEEQNEQRPLERKRVRARRFFCGFRFYHSAHSRFARELDATAGRVNARVFCLVSFASRSGARYGPVTLPFIFASRSGVPSATTRPPASPPPGPRSTT